MYLAKVVLQGFCYSLPGVLASFSLVIFLGSSFVLGRILGCWEMLSKPGGY